MTALATIRTARLVLRPYCAADRDDFIALLTDPEVTRYTDGPLPLERAEQIIDGILGDGHERVVAAWAVIDPESGSNSGSFAGHATILRNPTPESPEIGFMLWPAWRGRGLATEIARAVLDYGHESLGLSRIIATTDLDNVASQRVCEKIGMQFRERGLDGDVAYLIYEHEHD